MAAGVPVVASAVGGNSEIIESGKNGFLIPLKNEEEWVRIMKAIIQNIDLRRSVSKMAEQTVAQRFSLTMMMDRYERLYHMVNKEQ
jgi:glycosyltransferase involved in cell wall biosynthesis